MPEQDALLATRLYVPGPRPGFVPRPRLVERLDEGLGRGLALAAAVWFNWQLDRPVKRPLVAYDD